MRSRVASRRLNGSRGNRLLKAAALAGGLCACGQHDTVSNLEDQRTEVSFAIGTGPLQVAVPPDTDFRDFAVITDGWLDVRDSVTLASPVANMGSTWTHVGNDGSLGVLYTRPALTVGPRTAVTNSVFTGGTVSIAPSAPVTGTVQAGVFEPRNVQTLSLSLGTSAGPEIFIDVDQVRALEPGRYGRVQLQPGAKLQLRTGDYYFQTFPAIEPGSTIEVNDVDGPVRLFVGDVINFRGAVASTRTGVHPNLLLGVLGTGTVRVESAFQGTLWASNATLVLGTLSGTARHAGAFYAKHMEIQPRANPEFQPPSALECVPKQLRIPLVKACSSTTLARPAHTGPMRAIWDGEEEVERGKRAEPVENFTFRFGAPVSLESFADAVRIVSVDCPSSKLAPGCNHEVALKVAAVSGDPNSVMITNPDDPFLPGCKYELSIPSAPVTTSNACLSTPAKLSFRALDLSKNGSALQFETSTVRHRGKTREIAAFEFRDSIHWLPDEFFRERLEAFELRPGIDDFVKVGVPKETPLSPDSELVTYQQRYRGVPVEGQSFIVEQPAGGGAVRSAHGSALRGLNVPHQPLITATQAKNVAQAQLAGSAPEGAELVLTTNGSYTDPAQFKLSWRVDVTNAAAQHARTVHVDARNGTVLRSWLASQPFCSTADISGLSGSSTPTEITGDPPQSGWGYPDRNTFNVSSWLDAGGDPLYLLHRAGQLTPTREPEIYVQCENQGLYPNVVALPDKQQTSTWDPELKLAVDVQLATEACLRYFAEFPFPIRKGTWKGWDGSGALPIDLRIGETGSPNYLAVTSYVPHPHITVRPDFEHGASIDVMCHEFGHAFWAVSLDFAGWSSPEANALAEGFADVLGAVAEYKERGPGWEPSLWCLLGDIVDDDYCDVRFDDPASSFVPHPALYEGPNWCSPGSTTCETYNNRSLLAHWFYLIANGRTGSVNAAGCDVDVPPLDTNLQVSLDRAAQILLNTVNHGTEGEPQFASFANATISTAKSIGTPFADTVVAAWHAVGVWDGFWEGDGEGTGIPAVLSPERGAPAAPAWGGFEWEMPGVSTEVVAGIQIDLSATFDSQAGAPLFEDSVDTRLLRFDGPEDLRVIGRLDIALEPDTTYYWRTRVEPSVATPWSNCQAVHWFKTGPLPELETVHPIAKAVDSGRLQVIWPQVPYASEYKVQLSTFDTKCADDSDFSESVVPDVGRGAIDILHYHNIDGLQPEETYWLNILPIGPEDVNGEQPRGQCFTRRVNTRAMKPPFELGPVPGALFDYQSPHHAQFGDGDPLVWDWLASNQPASFEVNFYKQGEHADCGSEPDHVEAVVSPCPGTECALFKLEEDVFPVPHPSGYFWNVVAIAENGKRSPPSECSHFAYTLDAPDLIAPGVQAAYADIYLNPGALMTNDGDNYDQDVTFEWLPVAHATRYRLKVGRWPWFGGPELDSPDPPNCGIFETLCTEDPPQPPGSDPGEFIRNGLSFDGIVEGTSVTLPGAAAGRGRYCWSMWSMLGGPEPLADSRSEYCYTTGPAEPIITILSGPESGEVSSEPIVGTIEIDYVPDEQFQIFTSHPEDIQFSFEDCQPVTAPAGPPPNDGTRFKDYYGCLIEFEIATKPGQTYELVVRTYQSADFPGPIFEEEGLVHEVWMDPISVAECGKVGQPCCPEEAAGSVCETYTTCRDDVCVDCGQRGLPCCWDVGDWLRCPLGGTEAMPIACHQESDTCVGCGGPGQPCCGNNHNDGVECFDGYECKGEVLEYGDDTHLDLMYPGTCEEPPDCGEEGEPCCEEGAACMSGLECLDEECGCSSEVETILADSLTHYQDYCFPPEDWEPTCTDFADSCLTECYIEGHTVSELVANGTIPCERRLEFSWHNEGDTNEARVYYTQYPLLDSSAIATADWTGPIYSNSGVTHSEPVLYIVGVRSRNACGALGPADIGMVAVYDTCPIL